MESADLGDAPDFCHRSYTALRVLSGAATAAGTGEGFRRLYGLACIPGGQLSVCRAVRPQALEQGLSGPGCLRVEGDTQLCCLGVDEGQDGS